MGNAKESIYARLYHCMSDESSLVIMGYANQEFDEKDINNFLYQLREVCYKHNGDNISVDFFENVTFCFTGDNIMFNKICYIKGLAIHNITREEAIQFGMTINQKSIIWKDKDSIDYVDIKTVESSSLGELSGVCKTIYKLSDLLNKSVAVT